MASSLLTLHIGPFNFPMLLAFAGAVIMAIAMACKSRMGQQLIGADGVKFISAMLIAPLVLVAALSLGNYTDFLKSPRNFFNTYEFFHYYLGSKYTREIGYTNLYNAAVVAEFELGLAKNPQGRTIRDLNTGRSRAVADVLKEKDKYTSLFTPARWEEFKHDVKWFYGRSRSFWVKMLGDKGYNAPPVWSMLVGGLISNHVSTDNEAAMYRLPWLDMILLGIAFACVWWAFSLEAALVMIILLGTSYIMHMINMKAAYIRTDFVVSAVCGVCMLKLRRYKTAGALFAWSALSRVFPLLFSFGVGAKLLWNYFDRVGEEWRKSGDADGGSKMPRLASSLVTALPKIDRRYFEFFFSFAGTAILLVGASLIYDHGFALWADFFEKIERHNQDISPWRVGFKYIFMATFRGGVPVIDPTMYTNYIGVWYAIQAVMLLFVFFLCRRLADYDAAALGFVCVFFLVAPTYYYYMLLLIPLLFFTGSMQKPERAVGVILMLLCTLPGYWFWDKWERNFPTHYWLSVIMLFLACYMLFAAGLENWRASKLSACAESPEDA